MSSEVYIDPNLECDAPTFVDFANIASQYDDNADEWFDKRSADIEGTGKFSDDFSGPPLHIQTPPTPPEPAHETQEGCETEKGEEQEKEGQEMVEAVVEEPPLPTQAPPTLPNPAHQTEEGCETEGGQKSEVEEPPVHAQAPPTPLDHAGRAKRMARTVLEAVNRPKRKCTSGVKFDKDHLQHSVRKPVKTTEQLQLEEIKRLKEEAKKTLKNSRRSFMKNSKGPKLVKVVKGSKPPTEVKEFSFSSKPPASEDRSDSARRGVVINSTNFASTLRTRHPSDNCDFGNMSSKKPPTPEPATVPKPFKFELDKRPGLRSNTTAAAREDMPLAEFVTKYQKATPPRFRRAPSSGKKPPPGPPPTEGRADYSSGSHVTLPKTPNLLTKTRKRPLTHRSAAEMEEEEVEKMKQYQFKANPLNPDIISRGGIYGVPCRKDHPKLTHPQSPQLVTKKLASLRKAAAAEGEEEPDFETEDRKFVAQPMPDFSEIQGVPVKRTLPLTAAESPAIKKRRRLDTAGKSDEEDPNRVQIKANPLPNFDKVFAPHYPQRMVLPEPFSFEERDKNKNTKEKLVQKILSEEKKPEFKAQPVPNTTFQPAAPPKPNPSVTRPHPFNLHTESRGEHHTQKWKDQLEKQAEQEKQDMEFKATEVTGKLYSQPFTIEKSTKPLTRVDNVVLHSDVRSSQRAKYESAKKQRAYLFEMENLQRRALREAEEAREIAKLRRSLVHKAQPIGHYAPILIKPSDRPITQPKSPHFEVDRVLQKHSEAKSSKV